VKLLVFNTTQLMDFIPKEDIGGLINFIADDIIYAVNGKRGCSDEEIRSFIKRTVEGAVEKEGYPTTQPKATEVTSIANSMSPKTHCIDDCRF
jgi:hypothetical protein